jgi:pimeloyl-ACP methyl ester carboxylesterase
VRTVIVYVHGLWLNGWESVLLRQRLSRQLHCTALSFRYSSVGAGLSENARALRGFLAGLRADALHLVGHSLGGLVILELFESVATRGGAAEEGTMPLPPGRIVLLGSPVRGSRAARNLSLRPFGRRILGLTAHEALLPERERHWLGGRELGIIAGTVPVGFGRFMGPFDSPSDGTVLVTETHLVGAKQHLSLRTTHTGMVYSSEVARQAAAFLREGRFADEKPR